MAEHNLSIIFLEFNPCNDNEFYCSEQRKCLSPNLICDGCIDCIINDGTSLAEERNCPSKSKIFS